MKFDTVIIGGGLSGLSAGIDLVSHGKKVAIISSGQSSLHFSSGSLELLGYDAEGHPVTSPLEAMASLSPEHPYSRMGLDTVRGHLAKVRPMLEKAGIEVTGDYNRNHWRMTPVGLFKPAWLTMIDYVQINDPAKLPWRSVKLVNLRGFLDFFPAFIAAQLSERGVKCDMATVTVKVLEDQRKSATEMRATNIARVLHGDAIDELAAEVNRVAGDADVVLLPAVAGFDNFEVGRRLRNKVKRPLHFVATMGASVPGVRAQIMLQRHFSRLGGHYMLGDTVTRGNYKGNRLESVQTVNFSEDLLRADNFIFAAGSFFSHGLKAQPDGIIEPVLGLDVDAPADRTVWFDKNLFNSQPYMKYGVATEGAAFRALRNGTPVDNIFVVGAALSGADAMQQGAGAGIAILTGLNASSTILKA